MTNVIRREMPDITTEFRSGLHPILAQIYKNRGIETEAQIDQRLEHLISVETLLNAKEAASLIAENLYQQKHFMIVGDFDSDGATSSALAVHALKAFGAKNVSFLVPNRFEYGYGLTPEIVDLALKQHPDILITVDNGIANFDGVLHAKAAGLTVVITDHHLAAETLPAADVIVNPNQPGDAFASKCIAGVGVIFYVMLALRVVLRESQWFIKNNMTEPNMAEYLDLVALGTVADVVALDKNNRIMIQQGLKRIRQDKVRFGIKALLTIANREVKSLVASDLAFAVAPRLNAAGRLDDMSLGIQCLLSETAEEAKSYALKLDQLNKERREIEAQMQQEAFTALDQCALETMKNHAPGICVYDPKWHQGVIGILAARIKEKLHRPVIAFAKVSHDELKGSARSLAGLNIRDILVNIDREHPGVIIKFGGHAMAAGLSIKESQYELFHSLFAREAGKYLTENHLQRIIYTDGALNSEHLSLQLAEILRYAQPWGQEFPEPLFDGIFNVYDQRLVGQNHLKLLLALPGQERLVDAIAFNVDVNLWPNYHCQKIFAVYRLDVNEFQGRRNLQLVIEYLAPC